jgi:hypothetical protein
MHSYVLLLNVRKYATVGDEMKYIPLCSQKFTQYENDDLSTSAIFVSCLAYSKYEILMQSTKIVTAKGILLNGSATKSPTKCLCLSNLKVTLF